MSFLRRLFGRTKSSSNSKPARPDSPTNKIIKKFFFYGFFLFTTATIVSKKYKTNLIFTFQPTQQNLKQIDTNPTFHQGVYYPVYYMAFGWMQRFYAKYLEQAPYFRDNMQPATKDIYQIHQLPVHDKFSKKENISSIILITGYDGLNNGLKKLMLSMNANGFKSICIKTDDFHNIQRLQKTLNHLKSKHPNTKFYGIGVDYGANLLVNYAALNQKAFDCIVSLGNPLNLQQSEKNIQDSNFIWKKLVYEDILKGRIQKCQSFKQIMGQRITLSSDNIKLYDIDKSCYSGAFEDYSGLKNKLSSINSIKKLKIPSLFIQSQQDPFSISIEQNQKNIQNQHCIFVQTQRGGHQEWLQSMKLIRWVSRPIAQFIKSFQHRQGQGANI